MQPTSLLFILAFILDLRFSFLNETENKLRHFGPAKDNHEQPNILLPQLITTVIDLYIFHVSFGASAYRQLEFIVLLMIH